MGKYFQECQATALSSEVPEFQIPVLKSKGPRDPALEAETVYEEKNSISKTRSGLGRFRKSVKRCAATEGSTLFRILHTLPLLFVPGRLTAPDPYPACCFSGEDQV